MIPLHRFAFFTTAVRDTFTRLFLFTVSHRANEPGYNDLEETVAQKFDRITQNPKVLAGRAAIRGLRISVAHIVNLVANGMTPAQIVADLPDLEEEDVRQALTYAAALAYDEVHPIRA